MRRRSARLSSTGFSGSDSRDSVEYFNTRFSLISFLKKVRRLTNDQKKAIEQTGFGNLLLIPNQKLNKNLLLELMRRWNIEKHSFILPCGDIRLSLKDVALTLGLRVVGVPVMLDDDEPFLDLESWYGAAVWKRNVTVASVESKLDSLGEICNDDFVRTFLLYTFGTFLFPNADGKVDTRYLSLLKTVDRICSYAWGQAVLVHLMKWLDKRKELDAIYVGGCLLFLQIWSFEHIDIARPALLDISAAFPRMCQWDKSKPSNRQLIASKFKDLQGHQVTWELQPNSRESEIDVIKELLEAQSKEKELSEAGNSCADFPIVNDIDLGTRRQDRNQEVIEVESNSETNPTSEGPSEREVSLDSPGQNIPEILADVIHRRSTPFLVSSNDSSTVILIDDEEDLRTRVRILEEKNMKLKGELHQLKRENGLLKSSCLELEENSAKLKGENNDLRKKNQFLSSLPNNFVDRMDRILLGEDINIREVSHSTQ